MKTVLTGAIVLSLAAAAQAQDEPLELRSTEIAPGLYMLESADDRFTGGNMALSIGEDGVILIDDGIEQVGPELLESIAELTGEPVDYLINTHVHGDHTGSNAALHEHGAAIFAHDKLRARLAAGTGDDAVPPAALPEITYSDSVTFYLNGIKAYVFHVESAHTDGDSVIHFPDLNVIHTGDVLFNRLFPFIDLDSGGSVDGFLAAQDKILAMADDDTIIVPGHGGLADRADLALARDMLADSRDRVQALVDAGMSEDDIVAENPLADYHDTWNWGFITTERMTRQLYRSLTQ